MIAALRRPARARSRSAADKGYDAADFVEELRAINVRPHVAQNTERPPLGDRRADHAPSRLRRQPAHPQADRGGFGWMKTVGGLAQDQAARAATRSIGPSPSQRPPTISFGLPKLIGGDDMTRRTPAFARAFAGRWRIAEMDEWDETSISSSLHTSHSSARTAANWSSAPSRPISTCATARVTVQPAREFSWEGFDDDTPPADAVGLRSAPPGASSAMSSSTKGDDLGFVAERE